MNKSKRFLVWVAFFVLFLEMFYQLGGFIFSCQRELENKNKLKQGVSYKILCLGDSITASGGGDSYPNQLERTLNAKQIKAHFVVINKGVPGTGPNYILNHLNEYLSEYNPDLIIMMSGLNDDYSSQTKTIGPEINIFSKSKVYCLLESLGTQFLQKLKTMRFDLNFYKNAKQDGRKMMPIEAYVNEMASYTASNPSSENYTKLAFVARAGYKKEQALQYALKAMQLNPQNYIAQRLIVDYYLSTEDYKNAVPNLLEYMRLCPASDTEDREFVYNALDQSYTALNQKDQLVYVYYYAVMNFPRDEWPYTHLGILLFEQKKFSLAKDLFIRQLHYFPASPGTYEKLMDCYIKLGDTPSAMKLFKESIQIFPPSPSTLYFMLVKMLLKSGEEKEAERMLEKVLRIDHADPDSFKTVRLSTHYMSFYKLLIDTYALNGDMKRSEALRNAIDVFNQHKVTVYTKIFELLNNRGVSLVAVQYPLENLDILKEKLPPSKNLYFIDNESNFKRAVDQDGYFFYFVDLYGGDYGHCTPAGNQLLAENIAKTVFDITGITAGSF